jgi:hypothetical protein
VSGCLRELDGALLMFDSQTCFHNTGSTRIGQFDPRAVLFIGTTDQYKTEAQARKAVEAILLKLNAEKPMHHLGTVTFGGLCDRYIAEELPERYSTRKSYLSNIKLHIKPRWGRLPYRGG